MTDATQDTPNPAARAVVTSEELAVAFSGPSFTAEKFYITVGNSGVRIAFAELSPDHGKGPVRDTLGFRTAVTLSVGDAIALHRILREILGLAERELIQQGAIPVENL